MADGVVDLTNLSLDVSDAERKLIEPRPLIEEERPEEYPVGALPPVVRDAVREVASYVQAPLALIAGCALAAVSTAVQTRFSVRRDAALCGPATLYLLTIAESGERKSTVDSKFNTPVREWENKQKLEFKARKAKFKADFEDWERQGHDLRQNIDSGFIREQLGTDLDPRVLHELAKPKEPVLRRVLRSDDTPEALAISLASYPVASIISAEAGVIFGSHGMRPDAVMGNLAQANTMWDGGVIHQERQGRGITHVEGMRVTMGLQVQPAVMDAFVEKTNGLAKGIGYFARFLFSQPETTQGTRLYVKPPIDEPAMRAFRERMSTLLDMEAQFDEDDQLLTKHLTFDAQAYRIWMSFHDGVEERMGGDNEYSGVRDVASKAADNAARLACCLHVFSGDPAPEIGPTAMNGAVRLMYWYLGEAMRFARKAGDAPELADAQVLEEFLIRETNGRLRGRSSPVISLNEIRRKGPNKLRAPAKRLDAALEVLADHGRVLVTRRVGKKGADIVINHRVLAEYH